MDKRVILAVAGSGKTTFIINRLCIDERSLVVTYTNNNYRNLRVGILDKFGYMPDNITLLTYFTFLYSFCFRPFLSHKFRVKGINYEIKPNRYIKQNKDSFFLDKFGRLYSNRIAKLLESKNILGDINSRLSKYYENLFIDEVQDLAGHDFNLLRSISKANINILAVGDFFQHTYDTSRDGNVNRTLHDDYEKYKTNFSSMGITPDIKSLNKSYRCSPTVCNFIREKIGIEIYSQRNDETNCYFIEDVGKADTIIQNKNIIKLFYQGHSKYDCYSRNWGESKGENKYKDVCVVLNQTTLQMFLKDELKQLKPQTKNKLYVACSRASNDLYFVPSNLLEKYKKTDSSVISL